MTHNHKFTVHVLSLQLLKYWLKYCYFNALLIACSLYSSATRNSRRLQRSGVAAWKLASPALQLVLIYFQERNITVCVVGTYALLAFHKLYHHDQHVYKPLFYYYLWVYADPEAYMLKLSFGNIFIISFCYHKGNHDNYMNVLSGSN